MKLVIHNQQKIVCRIWYDFGHSFRVSTDFAKDICGVNFVTDDISPKSKMHQSAIDLNGLSSKLKDRISIFKVKE